MNPTSMYQQLVNEPVEYLLCPYGYTKGDNPLPQFALGFKGARAARELCRNLFDNFGRLHKTVELHDNLSYICVTMEELQATLALFFAIHITRSGEVKTEVSWDEETEVYDMKRDQAAADAWGAECAKAFIEGHIRRDSFLPTTAYQAMPDYAVSRIGRSSSTSRFESLVDRAGESA